jgi:hypothetical protein
MPINRTGPRARHRSQRGSTAAPGGGDRRWSPRCPSPSGREAARHDQREAPGRHETRHEQTRSRSTRPGRTRARRRGRPSTGRRRGPGSGSRRPRTARSAQLEPAACAVGGGHHALLLLDRSFEHRVDGEDVQAGSVLLCTGPPPSSTVTSTRRTSGASATATASATSFPAPSPTRCRPHAPEAARAGGRRTGAARARCRCVARPGWPAPAR